jgi:hypothetical protein
MKSGELARRKWAWSLLGRAYKEAYKEEKNMNN